jgi:SAM-dependent methyltransferase
MLAQAQARNRADVGRGRVRLSLARFDDTGLPERSVDRILAVNVAYFWSDAPRVLGELDRVLRPGGRIGIYVTDAAAMARWRFAASGHHRLFDARDKIAARRSRPGGGDRQAADSTGSFALRRGPDGVVVRP